MRWEVIGVIQRVAGLFQHHFPKSSLSVKDSEPMIIGILNMSQVKFPFSTAPNPFGSGSQATAHIGIT